MRLDELMRVVLTYAPRALVDESDDGEIVIALGKKLANDDATLVDLDFDEDLGEDG
jgi:hypothetical protein